MLDADALASGYRQLRAHAPRRLNQYLSPKRSGVTSSKGSSSRAEEHLAVGLFNRGKLTLPNGERLSLLDYQFPLKSAQTDAGIGKIDLLGLFEDGRLAVIELKARGNQEDRRIALVEGLVYAAIIEANIDRIAREIEGQFSSHEFQVVRGPPTIVLVAPWSFWSDIRAIPTAAELEAFAERVGRSVLIEIMILCLRDAELVAFGLAGDRPDLRGHAYLSFLDERSGEHRGTHAIDQREYLDDLFHTFWAHRKASFAPGDDLFEPRYTEGRHPPVFRDTSAARNLLMPPTVDAKVAARIEGAIPSKDRHRAFGSMRSSQALAQSVFAGLQAVGRLDALVGLVAEDGFPAFYNSYAGHVLTLEHHVSALGEPRPTSIDAFFTGPSTVAVEVKLTEPDFGRCSRPRLRPGDPNYERDHCDGNFTFQRNRAERCALSAIGVRYWRYIPQLFTWNGEDDYRPCPLEPTYQLVRNILAACVRDDSMLDTEASHVLVVYDERNPAFHPGTPADGQWWATLRALRYPRLLRRVSWQSIADHLGKFDDLNWLTEGLRRKYGLHRGGATGGLSRPLRGLRPP